MKRSADQAFEDDEEEILSLQDQLRRKYRRLQELQQGMEYIALLQRREQARAQARAGSSSPLPQPATPKQRRAVPRPKAPMKERRSTADITNTTPPQTPCPEENKYRQTCETIYGPSYIEWLNSSGAEYQRLQSAITREKNINKRQNLIQQMKMLNMQRRQLLRAVHPDKVAQSSDPNVQKYRHCDKLITSCAQFINSAQ